ncbi:unnamed protein product, partial [Notodromas monacha]
ATNGFCEIRRHIGARGFGRAIPAINCGGSAAARTMLPCPSRHSRAPFRRPCIRCRNARNSVVFAGKWSAVPSGAGEIADGPPPDFGYGPPAGHSGFYDFFPGGPGGPGGPEMGPGPGPFGPAPFPGQQNMPMPMDGGQFDGPMGPQPGPQRASPEFDLPPGGRDSGPMGAAGLIAVPAHFSLGAVYHARGEQMMIALGATLPGPEKPGSIE